MMITEKVTIQARQAFANKYLAEEPPATINNRRKTFESRGYSVPAGSLGHSWSSAQMFKHLKGL